MDSSRSTLKIGVLGFGSMGRTHTWAVRNLPFFFPSIAFSAETCSIVTRHPEKSEAICRQFGIPRFALSEEEILNDPAIDVIDVCTPNVAHRETLKKAIASGKHVFCEKPLCISPAEAKEILAVPRREGQILGMSFNYRWLAPVMRAKQLIDEGRIGRILHFDACYLHSSATDTQKPAGWKQDRTVCGGGVLFDLGSHVLDLMGWLCGRFCEVSGHSQIGYPERAGMDGLPWKTNADEAFYLTGTTAGGAVGTVRVGKLFVGTNDDLNFTIYGETGALRFSLMEPNWLDFYDCKAPAAPMGGERGFTRIECVGKYPDMGFPSPKAPAGWLNSHLNSVYNFLKACAEGSAFSPSLEEGAYVQAVMDAAYRSDAARSVLTEVEAL